MRDFNLDDFHQETEVSLCHSVTNQFFNITHKTRHARYLLRINGNLWPPFTREHEDANLLQLAKIGLKTGVLVNNFKRGFQICYKLPISRQWRYLPAPMRKNALKLLGRTLGTLQEKATFCGEYALRHVFLESTSSLKATQQEKYFHLLMIIQSMLASLTQEPFSLVASHNDLLPSSVYYCNPFLPVIVDWEYAGGNHPYSDVAQYSVHARLSSQEDQILLQALRIHQKTKNTSIPFLHFYMMKCVVLTQYLIWQLPKMRNESLMQLEQQIHHCIGDVIIQQGISCAIFSLRNKQFDSVVIPLPRKKRRHDIGQINPQEPELTM